MALGSALRATGIIKPAVGFQVLSVLLNIVLAPLLIGIASLMMLVLTLIAFLAPGTLIRIFSRDPRVIAFGSEYLRIVSVNFVSAGIVFVTSSVFQGIGNTLPPLFSSMTRLVLFAMPAIYISRTPRFEIRNVWYLSVGSIIFQMCINLLLLQHELRERLRFDEPDTFIPASATAAAGSLQFGQSAEEY